MLEAVLLAAGLVAGITGAWSPCGFSMVETLAPQGYAGRLRTTLVACATFAVGALAGGVLRPVRQTYLHQSIHSSERATLVSFDSLVSSLGSIGGSTGLGYLSQVRSVPVGFVVGGLATLLALPIFARLRALDEPADRIEAEDRERQASAAAPELPREQDAEQLGWRGGEVHAPGVGGANLLGGDPVEGLATVEAERAAGEHHVR